MNKTIVIEISLHIKWSQNIPRSCLITCTCIYLNFLCQNGKYTLYCILLCKFSLSLKIFDNFKEEVSLIKKSNLWITYMLFLLVTLSFWSGIVCSLIWYWSKFCCRVLYRLSSNIAVFSITLWPNYWYASVWFQMDIWGPSAGDC